MSGKGAEDQWFRGEQLHLPVNSISSRTGDLVLQFAFSSGGTHCLSSSKTFLQRPGAVQRLVINLCMPSAMLLEGIKN